MTERGSVLMLTGVMKILGLETSGLTGSVALSIDGVVTERKLATAGRRHAQTLLAEIRELLADHSLQPTDIDALAVSIGPGSFTGLRVGVVCAKTWAYATRCRVIAVDTLAAVAQLAPAPFTAVWVISDAQRGDFFTARYQREAVGWQRCGDVRLVHGSNWLSTLSCDDVVIGPGVSRLAADVDTPARIVRDAWAMTPTAAGVIAVAEPRLRAGETDDFWTLSPLYIRPSAAEEKRAMTESAS